jgi:hypothetical protein
MSKLSTICLLALTLTACGVPSDHFRLEGNFKGLDQGEFYLYSLDQGHQHIDTIRLNGGKLEYEAVQTDTALLMMLFPNFSEVPIVVAPGTKVVVEGEATHLKQTRVKGGVDNDLLTRFRLEHLNTPSKEMMAEVGNFIGEHPKSPASLYLLKRYLLHCPTPQVEEALRITEQRVERGTQSIEVLQLRNLLRRTLPQKSSDNKVIAKNDKEKMPPFSAKDIKGQPVGASKMKGEVNVIYTWSSWDSQSQDLQRRLRKLKKTYGERLGLMGFCLDADTMLIRYTLRYDSINWPTICESQLFESDNLKRLSLYSVPDNVVYNRRGQTIGRSLSMEDLEKLVKSFL